MRIRPIDGDAEVELVASRMRETLVEVLGDERGSSLYTMDWLRARVRWHLDPNACTGAVLVAESPCGTHVLGHTIVRVEQDESGASFGLFSTTFVAPASRRRSIASKLLASGESWMCERALAKAATYTASTNQKLIALYEKHGYRIDERRGGMVRLSKPLVTTEFDARRYRERQTLYKGRT